MDSTEMSVTDENQINIIRKKSSFLRDGSYRIFYITKKTKDENEEEDDDDECLTRKSLNRNGLKQLLFMDLPSNETKENTPNNERKNSTIRKTIQHRRRTFHNLYPQTQASIHRRRQRFLVACATVLIALTTIITIIVYVIIKTIKYNTQMNQHLRNHPR